MNTVIHRKTVLRLTIRPHYRGGFHIAGDGAHLCARTRHPTARRALGDVRAGLKGHSYVLEIYGPDHELFRTVQRYEPNFGVNGPSVIWMDDKDDQADFS